ncbi:MAG: hypothetical protein LBP92_12660 [Deltaproteobacteria bacterium]|jgi:hypothetical protein|nr:hypothetical protein [Deltaproteobacteria bacterium]
MAKNKKKKKAFDGFPAEQLHKLWGARKWGGVQKLLTQHRGNPQTARYLGYRPFAIYNQLSEAIFVDGHFGQAPDLARELAQVAHGPALAVLRDCSAIALDCLSALDPGFAPSSLETDPASLPGPWAEMRRRQASLTPEGMASPSPERRKAVDKLDQSFRKLPLAKSPSPYATFMARINTLAALGSEAERPIFSALGTLGRMIKDINGGQRIRAQYRGLSEIPSDVDLAGVARLAQHPAVATVLRFFLDRCVAQFGKAWLDDFKVVFLSHSTRPSDKEIAGIVKRIMQEYPDFDDFYACCRKAGQWKGWSDAERLILVCLEISDLLQACEEAIEDSNSGDIFSTQAADIWLNSVGPERLAQSLADMARYSALCRPGLPPWTARAAQVFSLFAANAPLSYPLDEWKPDLGQLSHACLASQWLFAGAGPIRENIEENMAKKGRKFSFSLAERKTMAKNVLLFYEKSDPDARDGKLNGRLMRLRELSVPDDFGRLLEEVVLLALSLCPLPRNSLHKNSYFWEYCLANKTFFTKNLPPDGIPALVMGLVDGDKYIGGDQSAPLLDLLGKAEEEEEEFFGDPWRRIQNLMNRKIPETAVTAGNILYMMMALSDPDPAIIAQLVKIGFPYLEKEGLWEPLIDFMSYSHSGARLKKIARLFKKSLQSLQKGNHFFFMGSIGSAIAYLNRHI